MSELANRLCARRPVPLIEDPAAPEDVVSDAHPVRPQLPPNHRPYIGIALLVDVDEDQIEQARGPRLC